MAKKKRHKKHQFKQSHLKSQVSPVASPETSDSSVSQLKATATRQITALAGVDDFGYVGADLKRIAALAITFFLGMLLLWLGFNHTSLGSTVYSWFQLV